MNRSRIEALVDAGVHGELKVPEWVIAATIEVLDTVDGDPDLEPCEAGDDGCHYLRLGDREGWGYERHSHGACPEYGDDQSEGPLNFVGKPYAGWDRTGGAFGS